MKKHYFNGLHGATTKTCCGRYFSTDVITVENKKNTTCKFCIKILSKKGK